MGASLAMIDCDYGHLAREGREHAVALRDAFAAETRRVDARWTPQREPQTGSVRAAWAE